MLLAVSCALAGCKRGAEARNGAPSASASNAPVAPQASGLPLPPKIIEAAVNPKHESAYSGPAGTVRGIVHAVGDAPPDEPETLAKIKDECAPARDVYGKVFREGPGRTLADVLVAVTGYRGYVPEQHSVVEVEASGCAWSSRTLALTFGQRIDVVAKDRRAYVPDLLGAKMAAQLIALPGGAGSALYPQSPGRYVLVDSMRIFATAEVLVLKYATHDVTGLDGRYTIERIPAGKATLSAFLPATGETVEKEIEITPSGVLEVNIDLPFNLAKYRERTSKVDAPAKGAPKPAASGATHGTVSPAASGSKASGGSAR